MRRLAGATLGTVGVVCLLAALAVGYAHRALFDSDQFAARATATLGDAAVQEQIAVAVTDDVVLRADRDLLAIRPLVESMAQQIVGSGAVRTLFRSSVADVHRSLFDRDARTVTLTVANLGVVLETALQQLAPEAADDIRADVEIVDAEPPAAVTRVVQAAEAIDGLGEALGVLALLALAGALALARDRRESLRRGGIGLAAGALLMLVAYWVAHARLLGQVDDPGLRAALNGVWDAYLLDLRNLLLLVAGCGAVVAAAAAAVLRPVSVERPLRRAWELGMSTPASSWARVGRALALIAAGALIVTDPLAALRIAAVGAGIALIYAGVQELLRLAMRPPTPDAAPARARLLPRNAVLAASAAALAIFAAGSLFLASGGASEAEAELPGCNGHPELCDRTLDDVTLAATHNSFSAADYPNWLFAQQERGIAGQLAAGVRGFLIDTYWGRSAPNGRVVTDLSDDDNASRREYVEEFGAEAVDAALRIRDNLGGYEAADGPRALYMCHRFCELGARLLKTDLEALRDFLVERPHQVVVLINQNEGVSADAFADAVREAGLEELVYRGPTDEWPTLGEMVRSGERLVVMAENPPFDGPAWYQRAYGITQETPYKFARPAELVAPGALARSCRPNRGPADAPLLLVNHWIDTSPAPRPSNAAKVNARDVLVRRVRACERRRGQRANLVAVDFFATGDLIGAVDELNAVGP